MLTLVLLGLIQWTVLSVCLKQSGLVFVDHVEPFPCIPAGAETTRSEMLISGFAGSIVQSPSVTVSISGSPSVMSTVFS